MGVNTVNLVTNRNWIVKNLFVMENINMMMQIPIPLHWAVPKKDCDLFYIVEVEWFCHFQCTSKCYRVYNTENVGHLCCSQI